MFDAIIVIGLPYFAKKIASDLSKFDETSKYIWLDTSAKIVDKIKYICLIFFAKAVYQIGGSSTPGGALKLALFLRRKIFFHWVGTDVLIAKDKYAQKKLNYGYLKRITHFCEVDWIQKELKDIFIDAEIVSLASFDSREIKEINMAFDSFSILTYIGKGKEQFYGIQKVIQLAKAFPEVQIRIVGISGYAGELPSNITLLGWVTNMNDEYRKCSLYLRLVEHDGLAFSVLEALSYGRYVAYSQRFDNTVQVKTVEELIACVNDLYLKYSKGALNINYAGIQFIRDFYSKESCLRKLEKKLNEN
ncbi:hypothetical protein [Bdellovibrio sp. HCB-162]|uniref:hypothetical protein n=1 Tax=Bdellovibrio sp. HCB-162 TaxID=3394234 RepID=UPI0039BCAFC7